MVAVDPGSKRVGLARSDETGTIAQPFGTLPADPAGTFVFSAQTNTVMTPNDDGEAERIRRDWLAEELNAHGMCSAGYVVEIRQLLDPPDAPSSNAHDVVYTGRCL